MTSPSTAQNLHDRLGQLSIQFSATDFVPQEDLLTQISLDWCESSPVNSEQALLRVLEQEVAHGTIGEGQCLQVVSCLSESARADFARFLIQIVDTPRYHQAFHECASSLTESELQAFIEVCVGKTPERFTYVAPFCDVAAQKITVVKEDGESESEHLLFHHCKTADELESLCRLCLESSHFQWKDSLRELMREKAPSQILGNLPLWLAEGGLTEDELTEILEAGLSSWSYYDKERFYTTAERELMRKLDTLGKNRDDDYSHQCELPERYALQYEACEEAASTRRLRYSLRHFDTIMSMVSDEVITGFLFSGIEGALPMGVVLPELNVPSTLIKNVVQKVEVDEHYFVVNTDLSDARGWCELGYAKKALQAVEERLYNFAPQLLRNSELAREVFGKVRAKRLLRKVRHEQPEIYVGVMVEQAEGPADFIPLIDYLSTSLEAFNRSYLTLWHGITLVEGSDRAKELVRDYLKEQARSILTDFPEFLFHPPLSTHVLNQQELIEAQKEVLENTCAGNLIQAALGEPLHSSVTDVLVYRFMNDGDFAQALLGEELSSYNLRPLRKQIPDREFFRRVVELVEEFGVGILKEHEALLGGVLKDRTLGRRFLVTCREEHNVSQLAEIAETVEDLASTHSWSKTLYKAVDLLTGRTLTSSMEQELQQLLSKSQFRRKCHRTEPQFARLSEEYLKVVNAPLASRKRQLESKQNALESLSERARKIASGVTKGELKRSLHNRIEKLTPIFAEVCRQRPLAVLADSMIEVLGEHAESAVLNSLPTILAFLPQHVVDLEEGLSEDAYRKAMQKVLRGLATDPGEHKPFNAPEVIEDAFTRLSPFIRATEGPEDQDLSERVIGEISNCRAFPFFEKRLRDLHKASLKQRGPILSNELYLLDDEFRQLVGAVAALELSPYLVQFENEVVLMQDEERVQMLSALEVAVRYNWDIRLGQVASVSELLERLEQEAANHLQQVLALPQGADGLSIEESVDLATYFATQMYASPQLTALYERAVQHIVAGTFEKWRAWGEVEDLETEQQALKRMKRSGYLPEKLSLAQYREWLVNYESDVKALEAARAAGAEDIREAARQSLQALSGYRELLVERQLTEEFAKRTLRENIEELQVKVDRLPNLSGEDYKRLKEEIFVLSQAKRPELDFWRMVVTLHELSRVSVESFTGDRRVVVNNSSLPIANVCKDIVKSFNSVPKLAEAGQALVSGIEYLSELSREGGLHSISSADMMDPFVYFRIGCLSGKRTCQHFSRTDEYARGLLATLVDPGVRVLTAHDSKGKVVGRAILRLMSNRSDQPVLVLETVYGSKVEPEVIGSLQRQAARKAERMQVPLYAECSVYEARDPSEVAMVYSKASRSTCIHSDAAGGVQNRGEFAFRATRLETSAV